MKYIIHKLVIIFCFTSCVTTTHIHYSDPNYLSSDEFSSYEELTKNNHVEIERTQNDTLDISSENYNTDDYYDYSFSSRIIRFLRRMFYCNYYGGIYTDYYWYNTDPFYCGTSIYSGYNWCSPYYSYYSYSPFYYNYEQSRTSAYVNTSYYFTESFGIQGGLRLEKSNTNSLLNGENFYLSEPSNVFEWSLVELGDNITDYEYNYDRIYPSLFLLYNLKDKGEIKFEFGRRINRPGFWSTNPFPEIDYEQNWIRQGNPYLRPEDIYKCELSYSASTPIGFLSTSVYYSEPTDLIDRH